MVGRLDWGGVDGQPLHTIPRITLRAKETYRKVRPDLYRFAFAWSEINLLPFRLSSSRIGDVHGDFYADSRPSPGMCLCLPAFS